MAIVNLDKVQAKYVGNLESVVFDTDVTNGIVFHLGELVSGERELHTVRVPDEDSIEKDPLLLHASPEVMYDPRKSSLKSFVLEKGKAGRAYYLTAGDVITLTEDLFTDKPVVGEYVVPTPGSNKLSPSADGTVTKGDDSKIEPRFKAKVIEETTLGFDGDKAYVIKVEKA